MRVAAASKKNFRERNHRDARGARRGQAAEFTCARGKNLRALIDLLQSQGGGAGEDEFVIGPPKGVVGRILTESASDFFAAKFGFRVVDRSTLSKQVAASETFTAARGHGLVAMRLDL